GCILSVGCAAEDPATDGDNGAGGGGDYSGADNNTGGPDVDDEGADVEPTYPTQHPRIYIEANRERLKAALDAGTPAATKFKAVVDGWVAGNDVWGFQIWNAALLGQLTGDAKYCTKAIAEVDTLV